MVMKGNESYFQQENNLKKEGSKTNLGTNYSQTKYMCLVNIAKDHFHKCYH